MSSNGQLGSTGQTSKSLGLPGIPLYKAAQLFFRQFLAMSRNITA